MAYKNIFDKKQLRIKSCILIVMFICTTILTPINAFSLSNENNKEAAFLFQKGIIVGYNGNLKLEDYFTIEQLIVVLVRLNGLENKIDTYYDKYSFKDVNVKKWSAPYFAIAKDHGIIKGNPDGTVNPEEFVTTDRLVTFLLRIMGYEDVDWNKVCDVAQQKGLLDRVAVHAKQALKRGTVTKIIYSTLEIKNVEGIVLGQKLGYFAKEEGLIAQYENYITNLADLTASDISKLVSPSVVYIQTDQGSGSGFITNSDGRVVTNYHVIEGCKNASVKLIDGRVFDVINVIDYDKENDIAVLKINSSDLSAVSLGDSDKLENGDMIYTIGSPIGFENTISDGLISNRERVIDGIKYIQISAPISSGSSGGVLVNKKAEVIGITSAGVNNAQNLNLAIPINQYKLLNRNLGVRLDELYGDEYPEYYEEIIDSPDIPNVGELEFIEIEPNNSFETANIIENGYTIHASLSPYDDTDMYVIDIPFESFIFAGFAPLGEENDLDQRMSLTLYDSNNQIVKIGDYNDINKTVSLYTKIIKGTYYLNIFQNRDLDYPWSNKNYLFYASYNQNK